MLGQVQLQAHHAEQFVLEVRVARELEGALQGWLAIQLNLLGTRRSSLLERRRVSAQKSSFNFGELH